MEQFNNEYHVPELAGYSVDGKTFYVDKDMPRYMKYKDQKIDVYKYLMIHESIEFGLRKTLGFSYDHAHNLATIAEWYQLKTDHEVTYTAYNDFCQKYIEITEDSTRTDIPPDLENPWTGKAYTQADLKMKFSDGPDGTVEETIKDARSAVKAVLGMLQR